MVEMVTYLPPTIPEYIMQLRNVRDMWDPWKYDFPDWEDAKAKFSLEEVYHDFRLKLTEFYGPLHDRMINQQNA